MIHYLKTDPIPFEMVSKRIKPFDIRFNDRKFEIGDILVLRYYDRKLELYKFDALVVKVLSVFQEEGYGIEKGFCVMGITVITDMNFNDIHFISYNTYFEPYSVINKIIKIEQDRFCEIHHIHRFKIDEDSGERSVLARNPVGDYIEINGTAVYANDESQLPILNKQFFV